MKVRIRKAPGAREVDGIKLDRLIPGSVHNVSPSLAAWLIVEGYAVPEMRNSDPDAEDGGRREFSGNPKESILAADRRRKRR